MLVWDQNILSCVYPLNATGQAKPTPQMTAGQPNNPCTAENVAAGRLFFPHRDQTKYVQCDLMGNAYTNSCPARLVWNAFLETCYSPMLPASTGRKWRWFSCLFYVSVEATEQTAWLKQGFFCLFVFLLLMTEFDVVSACLLICFSF